MNDTVCVLDANQRSALATVRSLGRHNLRVIAADDCQPTLAGSSRYCTHSFVYPSPHTDPLPFITALGEELAGYGSPVVLPMTDVTTLLLAQYAHMLPSVRIPIASLDALETLNDKWELHQRATKWNLPVPKTRRLDPTALLADVTDLPFPLVLKPARSQAWTGSAWVKGSVHYISAPADIESALSLDPHLRRIPYLVQEYIPGHGEGVFALFDRGNAVTFFAHKRLREKPPTGGVSVLSESVPLDPHLLNVSKRLLGSVPYHGVAMVEFKVRPDGAPFLIEVNPRFWGSLQLAVDAGVDFPWLLYQLAAGAPTDAPQEYRTAIRCRWLLGDLDALYLTLRSGAPLARKVRSALAFLTPFPRRTRHEVNRLDDLRPFFFEVRNHLLARGG